MRLLITGAFGFVGVNMVRVLAEKPDIFVVATDLHLPDTNAEQFLRPVSSSVKALYLDVTDRQAVVGALRAERITHILHAAALTPTREQEQAAPGQVVDVNLGGTHNLLLAALQLESVERVLTVSSSGVYGAPKPGLTGLQSEAGALKLDNLYAITKHSAELLTRRFCQISGKAMTAIRLGAIYGPMERPSATRPALSQPGQLAAALRDGRHVRVAGPNVVRDWTFAADAAEAVWLLFRADQWRHDIYNVSCGKGLSFRQVVETFEQYGLETEWVRDSHHADVRMLAGDERLPLDVGHLREDTGGYVPDTDFARGIAQMLKQDAT